MNRQVPLVKICGLTNIDDTLQSVEAGADLLGFNFYPESPRFVSFDAVYEIFQEIPPNILKVGVFVDNPVEEVVQIASELDLDYIQFHGEEPPEECNETGRPWLKAFRLREEKDLEQIPLFETDEILIDAFVPGQVGGTGVHADWSLARKAKKFGKKIFLAGGLNPENVAVAIASVQPYAVDVASGVEKKPGKKDWEKVELFIERAKGVSLRLVEK